MPDTHRVKISSRGAARLKSGHLWVYKSDVSAPEDIPPGSLVSVTDQRGKSLGTALYSSSSQIAIRMISRERVPDLLALIHTRVSDAIAYRDKFIRDTSA